MNGLKQKIEEVFTEAREGRYGTRLTDIEFAILQKLADYVCIPNEIAEEGKFLERAKILLFDHIIYPKEELHAIFKKHYFSKALELTLKQIESDLLGEPK